MSKRAYIGVGDEAKHVSRMYIGVNKRSKRVVKGYIGDADGKAQLFYRGSVVFAGRTIYRHGSLPGSVIEYDEFGTKKKLFVADSIYRGRGQWSRNEIAVPGLNDWNHTYYPIRDTNVIDESSGYIDLREVADLTPYEAKLTDAYFQAALTATMKPVLQSAKEGTDKIMASGYSNPAAEHCRSRTAGIELQLPNVYQLLVLYASGDVVDSFDPTLVTNRYYALGLYGTNRYRMCFENNSMSAWASTEVSVYNACALYYYGYLTNTEIKSYVARAIIPVAEL